MRATITLNTQGPADTVTATGNIHVVVDNGTYVLRDGTTEYAPILAIYERAHVVSIRLEQDADTTGTEQATQAQSSDAVRKYAPFPLTDLEIQAIRDKRARLDVDGSGECYLAFPMWADWNAVENAARREPWATGGRIQPIPLGAMFGGGGTLGPIVTVDGGNTTPAIIRQAARTARATRG